MLEPLMTTPSVVTNSRASFVARQPQTIVVVREELDYYVMPEGSMADRPFIFKLGGTGSTTSLSPDLAVGLGKDAIEMQTRVPDEDAGEYFDDEGNPLVMTDEQARIPQRRLFMLALLRRGCGKWLLDRRKIMDCSEPTPGSPMLHHLTTVSDVDATTEWGYREMEVGKCRMVSLAMLKNIEPSLPQTPMEKPSPVAGPLATGRPVAAAAAGPVNNIITQVEEPLPPTPTMMLRRPMRKCWWERRFLKCRIPAGMIDAVEKRAQQWREELEKQDRVHAAEADLMAVIARANPSSKPQGDLPFFNPDDEEQTRLMAKYQEAQADLLAHQQTAPSLARDLGTADGNPLLDDDALGLDIEVEEDLDWSPVSKPRGEPTEQLPGPYNLLLNQEVALRGAPILPNSETLAWYENSEHIVRLWTRRVYTVEYITL